MKRSKGQDQGRTPQFGTRKVQTTVRIPEDVLKYLKNRYGIFQRAIDALLIVPIRRAMAAEKNRISTELAQDQEETLDALMAFTEQSFPMTPTEREEFKQEIIQDMTLFIPELVNSMVAEIGAQKEINRETEK